MSNTTWPSSTTLRIWLPDGLALSDEAELVLADVVADATDAILERIDLDKLPTDPLDCPRTIARAIVLEAARLLSRRDSANGVIASGEYTIRTTTNDADIARLLKPWGLDPEP